MVLATPANCHIYVNSFYKRKTDRKFERPTSSFEIRDERLRIVFDLNATNKSMIFLADQIPKKFAGKNRVRNKLTYADNRFWNILTMCLLRTMGIEGCGTFRLNSKGQPKSIKSELEIR